MRSSIRWIVFAVFLLGSTPLIAQQQKARAKLFLREDGDAVRAAVEVRIEPGWHYYHTELGDGNGVGKPATAELSGGGLEFSSVRFPEPERIEQPGVGPGGSDAWIWGHHGKIYLYALGRAVEGESVDLDAVQLVLTGLTCEDSGSCIPLNLEVSSSGSGSDKAFKNFPADLNVGGGGEDAGTNVAASSAIGESPADPPADSPANPPNGVPAHPIAETVPESSGAAAFAGTAPPADSASWNEVAYAPYEARDDGPERNLLMWLAFAFIAGMILNVMPCVLPVVSIKVLSFVQQAGESKSRVIALGLAFSAGILTVFLILGAFAAFAQMGWGEQFQSEPFKIAMIAIVFGFSLSLFDVYELGVPNQVGQMAAARREGLGDAFFKGMLATVLATPCSGPFLGSTLTWALSQPKAIIFAIFAMAGLGMAAPYAVLTSNPALLKYVPKPGAWMQTFKHLMGFLLLGTVIFLMVSLRQDLMLFTVTFLIFVGLACWWWGHFANFDQTRAKKAAVFATAVLIVGAGARLSFVEFQNALVKPPADHELQWVEFDPDLLQRMHEQGRPVMLDFTADWCLTCKLNERFVYETAEVSGLLAQKGGIAMKADMTNASPRTEAIERLQNSLGAKSIPFMAIFSGDDWQRPYTFKDLVTVPQVTDVLTVFPDQAPLDLQASAHR